jgi:hypothetical protein
MKTFFESVVKDVLSLVPLDKTFFIIPNRRSKTFLKKEIIKSIKGAALSPNIISIDDFIELISEKKESPKTTQIFNLYEAYMNVSKKKDFDSYSSFRNWSAMRFLSICMRFKNFKHFQMKMLKVNLSFGK